MNDTMRRERGLAEIQAFLRREKQSLAEDMIIAAYQSDVPITAIEVMQKTAGITDVRLAELRKKAQTV